ncbi:hypothetical protein BJY01DRAFT_234715 [Aspergillus pseudoustus]|uniref:Uncharacterized protein n=1 Tax=Aspergillus pseudoustus TaxID=1810923 RepID=A0ABR4K231_9EURO
MARLSQGFLRAFLIFLLFQVGFSLVFKEIPAPDVVPRALRTRTAEDLDLSYLDLLSRDSFYWTGAQNGHPTLANLTIDLPGDDETVISIDRFKHLLTSIYCTNMTMTVKLKNDKAYEYIKRGWEWLNDVAPNKLVVVAGAGDCGWNPTRIPFAASTVVFDDVANTARLVGKTMTWRDFQNYELTVGRYRPVSDAVSRRDIDKTLALPFNLPLPFSSGQINTPVDALDLTWFCVDCGTQGSFDFGFHIETKYGVPKDASISLSPNSVKAVLTPRIAIQADIGGDIDDEWEIGKIPVGGISIPGGILDVGPQVTFSLGYSIGPLQGSAGISTGVSVSIPDDSELEISLISPDISSTGWAPKLEMKPITVDARLVGEVLVYVKASIDLSAEALGQGFEAGINLKPYVGGALMAQATSGEVCEGEEDHYGVKVYPKAGVALNADVAKADDPADPLAEAVIASVTASLPTYCAGFGGDKDPSSTPGPSSSAPTPAPSATSNPTESSSPVSTSACTPCSSSKLVRRELYTTRVF